MKLAALVRIVSAADIWDAANPSVFIMSRSRRGSGAFGQTERTGGRS